MFTAREVITAYTEDLLAVLECKTDSNRTKKAQRDRLLCQLLSTLPADICLSCEGTAVDPAKLNAGSVAEMVLKYHYEGRPAVAVLEKSGGIADLITAEGEAVEIKLCVNGTCYNTPLARPSRVFLVNADGVYNIPAEAVAVMMGVSKKLPATHAKVMAFAGVVRMEALSIAMGYSAQ